MRGLSPSQAAAALASGSTTAEKLLSFCLKRKALSRSAGLNAFAASDYNESQLQEKAKASDVRRAQGAPLGPLDGVPFSVKDNLCVAGDLTTAGSHILSTFRSPYTATCVENLLAGGAILIGTTNMDEFGMGSSSSSCSRGPVLSPYSPGFPSAPSPHSALTPGGSSGGTAVAVALGAGMFGVGSDTGGSVRQPAAFCGLVGFKPSHGYVSRKGLIAYASSLDCPAVCARSVADAALSLHVMASSGEGTDALYSPGPRAPLLPDGQGIGTLDGVTIGVPEEYCVEELGEESLDAWRKGLQWLADGGAKVVPVSLPWTKYALPTYYTIAPAEASSNLSRYDGLRYGYSARVDPGASFHELYTSTRSAGFGREVQRRIMTGAFVLSESQRAEYFEAAQRMRQLISQDYENVFSSGVDALLTPTTPTGPWPVAETAAMDPVTSYAHDVMTVPASLARLPAMNVPVGLRQSDNTPIGLQVIGPYLREAAVVRVGLALEAAAQFVLPSHIAGELE